MSVINLGIFHEYRPTEIAELNEALFELTGDRPQKEEIEDFAGPNDVVQLLIDAANWQRILLIFSAIFGAAFAAELGKLTAAEIWKEKRNYYEALKRGAAARLERVFQAIRALQEKEQTVTVAVKIPGAPRNAALALESDDLALIAWQIANVTRCAEEIRNIVDEACRENPDYPPTKHELNPDLSIVIKVLDNGDVEVLGKIIRK